MPNIFINEMKRLSGTIIFRSLIGDPEQKYHLYVPRRGYRDVFITVHGVKRMAKEHAVEFAPFAERYGVVLIAPVFPKKRFCDYQRLGYKKNSARADVALNRIIEEVGLLTGANTDNIFMFGYSGGGQFVHRYAMVYPQTPKRTVIAAPGWYTFPDYKVSYPYGIKKAPGLGSVTFDLTRFLSIPACVMVGEKDVYRYAELNKNPRVDEQQGINRLDRGENWIRAMKKAARVRNLDTKFDFQVLPGCNHSFINCMHRGQMGERVFKFLFDSF